MAGTWKLEGQVMGQAAHHEVRAEWVLNHQFLRIQENTAANAANNEHGYEALWFLGYDPISERYVLHLLDVFGGRFSETLATEPATAIRFASFLSMPTAHSIQPIAGIPRTTRGNG